MKEPKDKRTKEYKKWKEMQGMGDVVEATLKATKIDKVAKWMLGEDCGCEERKEKLNKMFPFKQVKCLEEDEYKWLQTYFKTSQSKINVEDQQRLVDIYNRVFNKKIGVSNCPSCVRQTIQEIKKLYNEYE